MVFTFFPPKHPAPPSLGRLPLLLFLALCLQGGAPSASSYPNSVKRDLACSKTPRPLQNPKETSSPKHYKTQKNKTQNGPKQNQQTSPKNDSFLRPHQPGTDLKSRRSRRSYCFPLKQKDVVFRTNGMAAEDGRRVEKKTPGLPRLLRLY